MPQWFSTRSALAGATCVAASNVAGVSAVASKRDVAFLDEQVSPKRRQLVRRGLRAHHHAFPAG
jgi:hypothetical protein